MTPTSILNLTETVPLAGSVAPSTNGHPSNDNSSDENTKLELRHPPTASPELFASLKFFESVEELQDIATGLAFANQDEQDIVNELKNLHELRIKHLDDQYKAQEEFQKLRIGITNGRIESETKVLEEARRKTSTLEGVDRQLKEEGQNVGNDISLSLQQLKQERLQHEKEFFDGEIVRLQNKQRQEEVVESIEAEFAVAEKIYDLKQRQYILNRPELQRLADDAESEKQGVEAQLQQVRGRLRRFQRLGVTRTTAGFLVHAGYASFAAVGALIAGFFHTRQGQNGDFLSRIIGGVRDLIGLTKGGWAIWSSLLNLVLLIGFGIFVVTVTTFIMNWLIGLLDRDWQKRTARDRRSEEKKGFTGRLKHLTSWVGSLFQSEQDKQQSSRNRSNKDDNGHLERGAFVQLLAQMPFVIGAALVFFFFAALSPATGGQPGGAPAPGPLEISSTYIGVIFLTLSTSAAILYVTHVIEPRWHRQETQLTVPDDEDAVAPQRTGFKDTLKLNWEFVVLVIALVLSLAMTAFLPARDPYNSMALGSVAIFMSLASLGLAYGLIQKGLFKDFDVLERKRQDYRKQADACNQLPKMEGVFENFDSKEIGQGFSDSRSTQRKIDDLRVLYELKRIFGRDFEDDAKLEAFLAQFVTSDISLDGMKRPAATVDPFDGRFPVSTERLEAYYSQRGQLGHVDTQLVANREELEKVRSQADKLNADLDRLYEELLDQQLKLIELKREYSDRRQQLEINHKKEILWLKSAYRIGNTAHQLIQPPPRELGAQS